MISAIVLAGGYARRFQRKGEKWVDKLLINFKGEPIIKRVLNVVSSVADEVIISTDSFERGMHYKNLIGDSKVKVVVDRPDLLCEGPLKGITTATKYVKNKFVIVVPGDMPLITPRTLINLVNKIGDYDVVTPLWYDGSVETLIFASKRSALKKYSCFLCRQGFWRTTGIQRLSLSTLYVPICEITDDPNEFLDVNYRDDTTRELKFEGKTKSISIKFNVNLKSDADEAFRAGHFFLAALKYLKTTKMEDKYRSIKALEKEAEFYLSMGIRVIAIQAFEDASKILERWGLNAIADYYQRKAMELRMSKF